LNIYKTALKVSFIDYVRPEKKFSGITSLKNQIKKDISKAKKILN
jgi:riboflavin kinase/FMN adenylyltransferase